MNTKKIAINGFGRIGRLFFRDVALNHPELEVVAINDLGDIENLAYLLKYDTAYKKFPKEIKVVNTETEKSIEIEGRKTIFIQEKDATKLPWGSMGIDIVVESTGVYESFEKNKAHLDAGAKRVVITAPAKDPDGEQASNGAGEDGQVQFEGGQTVLMGINEDKLKTCRISSNASCTTNSASPVIAILEEALGIEKAMLTTIHAYTNTQTIVDSPVKGSDFRRGRAGAQNIVPSTTGAAIAVTRAIPDLKGKFDGIAMRVPTVAGSISDITFLAKKNTTVEEVNQILKDASNSDKWKNILKVTDDQIVSSDVIGEPFGALVDLKMTKVVDGNLVKVLSWYDNEGGYVAMLVKHVNKAAELV